METSVHGALLAGDGPGDGGGLSDSDDLDSLSSSSIHVSLSAGAASPLRPPFLDASSRLRQEPSDKPTARSPRSVVWPDADNVADAARQALEASPSIEAGSDGEETRPDGEDGLSAHDKNDDDKNNGNENDNDRTVESSFTSSLSAVTELSDISSLPSSDSSKATTPAETETTRRQRSEEHSQPSKLPSYYHNIERLNFTIRPKSSIPTNMTLQQYASECIEAAESSRLNPYALHPEEYHLLRHHISHPQVTTYLNIRNGILRLWMRRPWSGVKRQEAVGCANARWFDAANVCYDWLVRRGYINFGCVQLPEASDYGPDLPQVKRRKTVAVVGAGISGLACARQLEGLFKQYADRLLEKGEQVPRVVVVEGRGRVGGRVYSREFKSKPAGEQGELPARRHTAEMGGMIITGFDRGNPMNVLVRGQLGLPYHALTADTTIYDSNGKPVDAVRDQLVERLYNDCLDRVSEFKFKPQPAKLIEGNRNFLTEGRDSLADGSKTIMQAEEAAAALPDAPPVAQQNVPEKVNMVPVSAHKLTGRVHNEPGVPATLRAAEKAKLMGWSLRSGASSEHNIDLGAAAARADATLGSVLDEAISQYRHLVDLSAQDHRLINWHVANLEYSNANNLHSLSLGLWDMDAGNEWEGQHTMVVGGYQSVARGLLRCPTMLELKTGFAVKMIGYDDDGFPGPAVVESESGDSVEAEFVVCTVPLGVLKQGSIAFDPPLPPWKTGVIDRLGFGILNKVVLVYEEVFWEPDRHIFGVLRDAPNRHSTAQRDYGANRGRFFQWFNVTKATGLPCLIALMAGDAGFETEHTRNDHLVAEATEVLRSVFGKDVPFPVEAVVTRWGSDRFARGSYSSAAPGMLPDDYDTMSRPVGNLFFAGEHTMGTHPATVHGAYLSGLRAAGEVLEAMLGPIEVPTPLVLPRDSLLLLKRKQAAEDPRQARLDAYDMEVEEHVRSRIGERPARPSKAAANAYVLYNRAHYDEARRRCEATRRPGRTARSLPNEVRVMTSRMWREAGPDERRPFEERAAEEKRAYAEAMARFGEESQRWELEAVALRAAYVRDHPSVPGPHEPPGPEAGAEEARGGVKHRRARYAG